MTGGALVVRKGTRYVMTKVAHDGYDILRVHLDDIKQFLKTATTPESVVKEYLRLRAQGPLQHADFDPCDPLGVDEDRCRLVRDYADLPTGEEAMNRMEQELRNDVTQDDLEDMDDEDPIMQLSCSYCDYITFVDLDKKTVEINGKVS